MKEPFLLQELQEIKAEVSKCDDTLFYIYTHKDEGWVEFSGAQDKLAHTIYNVLSSGLSKKAKKEERIIADSIMYGIIALVQDMDESSMKFSEIMNEVYREVQEQMNEHNINLN